MTYTYSEWRLYTLVCSCLLAGFDVENFSSLQCESWIPPNLPQASCDRVCGLFWGDVRLDLLNKFQEEKCHLGLVTSNPEAWKFGAEFAGWFYYKSRDAQPCKGRFFLCDMEYGHQWNNRNGVSKCCKIRREKWYVVGCWAPVRPVVNRCEGVLGGGWWHC